MLKFENPFSRAGVSNLFCKEQVGKYLELCRLHSTCFKHFPSAFVALKQP
jgi:hypothetical protein